MNHGEPVAQITWKESILIFIALYAIRELLSHYLIRSHRKVGKQFYAGEWSGLNETCQKLKRLAGILAGGPLNPWIRVIYNDLCMIMGALAYLNGNTDEFLHHSHAIKKEKTYSMADCCLALYYRSIQNNEMAIRHYNQYTQAQNKNPNITCVLDYLFADASNSAIRLETAKEAMGNLKNTLLLKLLEENSFK